MKFGTVLQGDSIVLMYLGAPELSMQVSALVLYATGPWSASGVRRGGIVKLSYRTMVEIQVLEW